MILGVGFALVISLIFLYAPPAMGLGELSRIVFFHVPLAWIGVLAYLVSMIHAIYYLRTGNLLHERIAASNAEIGTIFALLATLTGAVFAKATWGAYWNWDPRQTTILVILWIYGAYFILRNSLQGHSKPRISSVYLILASLSVPFFVFIAPRFYTSLHPTPVINSQGTILLEAKMFRVFILSFLAFTGLYVWLYRLNRKVIALEVKCLGGFFHG